MTIFDRGFNSSVLIKHKLPDDARRQAAAKLSGAAGLVDLRIDGDMLELRVEAFSEAETLWKTFLGERRGQLKAAEEARRADAWANRKTPPRAAKKDGETDG